MTGLGSVTFVLLCGLSMARIALGAECIGIRPVDAPQPIPVYGALCGKAVDQTGGPMAEAELDLFSEAGVVVAKAQTDPTGTFKFSPLPTGKYRVGLSGFLTTREILDITSADQQTCERPLSVRLSLNSEECAESHIRTGSGLRFDVVPKIGRVSVDGILWGDLWELSIPYGPRDGIWRLPPGPHHIEVQSPGYDRLVVDVLIKEYEVTTYSGFLTETIDAGSRGAPTFAPR